MSESDVLEVADRFFAAIEAGDRDVVDELYADDAEVWHSVTGRTVDRATALAILDWLMAPGVGRTYRIDERLVVGDRLSQRHTLTVTVPGHDAIVMPVSIYLTILDGTISRIDEYGDRALSDLLLELIPFRR